MNLRWLKLTLIPGPNPPPVVPDGGGPVDFDITITSNSDCLLTGQAWLEARLPNENLIPLGIANVTLQPLQNLRVQNLTRYVPGAAPAGIYSVFLRIGRYTDPIIGSDEFVFEKPETAALRQRSSTTVIVAR